MGGGKGTGGGTEKGAGAGVQRWRDAGVKCKTLLVGIWYALEYLKNKNAR